MNWRRYFSNRTIDRGNAYYQSGNVKNLMVGEGFAEATVKGTRAYDVYVEFNDENVTHMECNCPHANDGYHCKHMAAVCTALEANAAHHKTVPSKANNYFERMSIKDGYFNIKEITRALKISNSDFDKANALLQKGKITDIQIAEYIDYRAGFVLHISGFVQNTRRYPQEVYLTLGSDYIIDGYCNSCFQSFRWGSGCSHLCALLIYAAEYINENNPGDYTDYHAVSLINSFRKAKAATNAEASGYRKQKIMLEPRIEMNQRKKLMLSFKIGSGKMYVLKSMGDLVDAYNEKKEMSLGKDNTLNFAVDSFEEKSQKFYDFIARNVEEDRARADIYDGKSYYNNIQPLIKKEMILQGASLDEFFDLVGERKLELTDATGQKKKTGQVMLCDGRLDLRIKVDAFRNRDGGFAGIKLSGRKPEIFRGHEYCYAVDESKLMRIDKGQMEKLEPLYSNPDSDSFNMVAGKGYLSEFYHTVLPQMEDIAEVTFDDREELEAYMPPEAEFSFYLDAEDGNVTCVVKCAYGEKSLEMEDLINYHEGEIIRDRYREVQLLNRIGGIFPAFDEKKMEYSCGYDEGAVYEFLNRGMDELLEYGQIHTTAAFDRLLIHKRPVIKMGVSMENNLMELELTSPDIPQDELLDVLDAYKKKKKYHKLKNGSFISLEGDVMEEVAMMFESMNISPKEFVDGKMHLPAYRALYLDKMLEENENIYAERDKHFRTMVKEFKTVKESDAEVPDSLKGIMRNYQEYGFKWLKTLDNYGFGGILADEMGLGKTLQVIGVLLSEKNAGGTDTSIVVSPASLVYNWYEEFEKFAPDMKVGVVAGKPSERKKIIKAYAGYDVLVTSYDLLKRDIDAYEGITFRYEVIDEAQFIKNAGTASSKAVKVLSAKTRFALTGTPIENRLSELWSICDYLMPGYLYSYDMFRRNLETPIIRNNDEDRKKQLRRMASPFILRRKKADVIKDLPEKIEEIQYAHLDEEQSKIYDGQVVRMRQMIESQSEEEFGKSSIKVLAELTKIRQICCDPSLIFSDYKGESAKRQAAIELIESGIEGEHKMLLFSQFTSMLALLEDDLNKKKIPYYKLTGETPKEKRVELVRKFNSDDVPVFLISLKAGGTGLNLVGADVVIHYDPWWNIAVQNQATDRAHRIGQKKVVSVYKLIAKNTIEEKIVKMQESKKELADEILSGASGGIMGMTREELLDIL